MNASAQTPTMPSVNAGVPPPPLTVGGARKPKATKQHICGRDRLVTKDGRSYVVVINNQKVTLTEAKKMDVAWRKEKKAKEAAAKAKKAAKTAKASKAKKAAKH